VNIKTATRALAALSQPRRLRLFRHLVSAGRAGATLSFHLKELVDAKLVTRERQGRHRIYRASFGEINSLLTYLAEDCCRGQSCEINLTSKAEP
jgi:ArsR family transcriptional regulator